MADGDAAPLKKNSDLPVRLASAIVMLAIAGTVWWIGGWLWVAFCGLLAVGVYWEWIRLSRGFTEKVSGRICWALAGALYIGFSAYALTTLRFINAASSPDFGKESVAYIVFAVVAVDVGAYFSGRAIGGPKIAPKISPSKTWAGLTGGAIFLFFGLIMATLIETGVGGFGPTLAKCSFFECIGDHVSSVAADPHWPTFGWLLLLSFGIAVVAQTGDFFESWMKRRAGLKDSSNLIPGHGGLFDRVDGLLAVSFVLGLILLFTGSLTW